MNARDILSRVKNKIKREIVLKDLSKFAEKNRKEISDNLDSKPSNKVFVCWFQGFENAPEVVRLCHKSLEQTLNEEYDLIDITMDNYSQYITIPQFIIDKVNNKKITLTHFSDLIRLELLIKYGGIWIDSTVLLTQSIPKAVKDCEIFMPQMFDAESTNRTKSISSWFISSWSNNKMLIITRNVFYYYWKKHGKLVDYFLIYHVFVRIAIKLFKEDWNKSMIVSAPVSRTLECILFEPYNETRYNFIINQTFMHKLTYKYDQSFFDKQGTVYQKLLEKYNMK